jgi:hypothetical protein
MPTALDSARTGTPDTGTGIKIPTILMREDSTLEAPGGVALSDHIANGPSAHRTAIASADSATDMSSAAFGTSTALVNNRGTLCVWVAFNVAASQATVRPVFYDDAATPAPMALGPLLSFTASAKRLSASGKYMTEAQLVDTRGFKRVKVFVESITASESADVYAEAI